MLLLALATLAATPASLPGVIASARPGDVVRLVAGRYPVVTIRNKAFDPPLTIDASDATAAGLQVINASGVRWTGGTLQADGGGTTNGYGVFAAASQNISIKGVHFNDFRVGIVYDTVSGGEISNNWFTRMTIDGIDLAASRDIVVARNACSESRPSDNAHPDCIQAWSRPGTPPVSNLTITGNSMIGSTQGISLFNHVRDGVDDGGFDRIAIIGNTVLNTYAIGIAAYDCRGCTVRNNTVASLPDHLNRAQLIVVGGSVIQCGNDVPLVPRQATPPCTN